MSILTKKEYLEHLPKESIIILSIEVLPHQLQQQIKENHYQYKYNLHHIGKILDVPYSDPLMATLFEGHAEHQICFVAYDNKKDITTAIDEDKATFVKELDCEGLYEGLMRVNDRLEIMQDIISHGQYDHFPDEIKEIVSRFIENADKFISEEKIVIVTKQIQPDELGL